MKTFKKIVASFLLILGLSIFLLAIADLADSTETKENKEGAFAAMLIFGLPSIATGTWLVWNLSQQHQKQLQQKNLDREQLFLRLLQQQEGEITTNSHRRSQTLSRRKSQTIKRQL